MDNSNPSGSTEEPIQVACMKVCHIGDYMWKLFLSYLRSRIGSTKSLKTLKGKTRAIKVTGYSFNEELPNDIDFTLVLLCGGSGSCRAEPHFWVKGLKSLPKELRNPGRHLNVVLCTGRCTVEIGEGTSAINALSFGIESHVMCTQRESKSLTTIKKALIEQLE